MPIFIHQYQNCKYKFPVLKIYYTFQISSFYQMANLSFLMSLLALSLSHVFAADPSNLQDFCVANPIDQGIIYKYIFLEN
jgi:hypothetical protein